MEYPLLGSCSGDFPLPIAVPMFARALLSSQPPFAAANHSNVLPWWGCISIIDTSHTLQVLGEPVMKDVLNRDKLVEFTPLIFDQNLPAFTEFLVEKVLDT